jgi:hypothetical protein
MVPLQLLVELRVLQLLSIELQYNATAAVLQYTFAVDQCQLAPHIQNCNTWSCAKLCVDAACPCLLSNAAVVVSIIEACSIGVYHLTHDLLVGSRSTS